MSHTHNLQDRAVRGLSIIEIFFSEVLLLCCEEHFHLLPGRGVLWDKTECVRVKLNWRQEL